MRPLIYSLVLGFAIAVVAVLGVAWSRGRTDRAFDGTAEWTSETVTFYTQGDCSASPWWIDPDASGTADLARRWIQMGKPKALHITFVGDLSRVGRWGQSGKYWRAVRPQEILAVSGGPAGCSQ